MITHVHSGKHAGYHQVQHTKPLITILHIINKTTPIGTCLRLRYESIFIELVINSPCYIYIYMQRQIYGPHTATELLTAARASTHPSQSEKAFKGTDVRPILFTIASKRTSDTRRFFQKSYKYT